MEVDFHMKEFDAIDLKNFNFLEVPNPSQTINK